MEDRNRRLLYAVLLSLCLLPLTLVFLYNGALQALWMPQPEPVDWNVQVNDLIAEIPTCVKSCIFLRIDDLGCQHSDYGCVCRELYRLDDPPELEDPNSIADDPNGDAINAPEDLVPFKRPNGEGDSSTESGEGEDIHVPDQGGESTPEEVDIKALDVKAGYQLAGEVVGAKIGASKEAQAGDKEMPAVEAHWTNITARTGIAKRVLEDSKRNNVSGRSLKRTHVSPVSDRESFSSCVELCANGAVLNFMPSRILDVCDAYEEEAYLPGFMLKTLMLYGRQVRASGSVSSFISSVASTVVTTPTSLRTTSTETTATTTTPSITTSVSKTTSVSSSTPSSSSSGSSSTTFFTTTSYTTVAPCEATLTSSVTGALGITVYIGVTGTSAATSSCTSSPVSNGLSSGAKIGLGVAIALVVLLGLGFLVFWILRRRRARAGIDEPRLPELPEATSMRGELDGNHEKKPPMGVASGQIYEMGQPIVVDVHELKADTVLPMAPLVHELRDDSLAAEMPATNPYPVQPPPAVIARKAVHSPTTPSTTTTTTTTTTPSSFPAPWEDTGESSFSAPYLRPQAQTTEAEKDTELKELEEEMARIKEEKDRLRRMQSLEVREKELRKTIEARRRGAGAGGV